MPGRVRRLRGGRHVAPEFALRWLDAHLEACAALGKPLALTEFGRQPAGLARAAFYGALYAHAERRMAAGAPPAGTAFWTAAARGYPDYDGFTVRLPPGADDDGAGAAFVAHAATLAALGGDAPGACLPPPNRPGNPAKPARAPVLDDRRLKDVKLG